MLSEDIPGLVEYPPMGDFIIFLSKMPSVLWSEKPILYYRNNKWDALGMLGERLHKTTIRTKYLQLCFRQAGLRITDIMDNQDAMFKHYKTNKERFLAALHYVEDKVTNAQMKDIYSKSKKLSDDKFYYE
tara:strand:- start:303 stop:692 length:390 start_codon:yes stop_codon:yes gene_type:complete